MFNTVKILYQALKSIATKVRMFDYDFLKKSGHLNEGRRGKVLFVPQTSFTRSWHKLS